MSTYDEQLASVRRGDATIADTGISTQIAAWLVEDGCVVSSPFVTYEDCEACWEDGFEECQGHVEFPTGEEDAV